MATIVLSDGNRIPMVKPTAWDGVEVERQTGWDRKKYAEMTRFVNVSNAIALFASLRRAGYDDVTFESCMQYDGIENIVAQPGDIARAEAAANEGEGEETLDPQ